MQQRLRRHHLPRMHRKRTQPLLRMIIVHMFHHPIIRELADIIRDRRKRRRRVVARQTRDDHERLHLTRTGEQDRREVLGGVVAAEVVDGGHAREVVVFDDALW